MQKVKIIPKKIGKTKLMFVKIIKEHTGLGLKEAKDWCDRISEPNNLPYFELTIKTSLESFKLSLKGNLPEYEFEFYDKEEQRNLKLLALGLGDLEDKIDVVSKELSIKLLNMTRYHIYEEDDDLIYDIYLEFFKDFLVDLGDKNLDKIIKEKLKRLTNG